MGKGKLFSGGAAANEFQISFFFFIFFLPIVYHLFNHFIYLTKLLACALLVL